MPHELSSRLRTAVEADLPHLSRLTDQLSAIQPNGSDSWSPKQELGHLIDSAANNHVRIVQAALAVASPVPFQTYAQNGWVNLHDYQNLPWTSLVGFWSQFNFFLSELIGKIPEASLEHTGVFGAETPLTLRFLIADYIVHMQHHLDHLLRRAHVTPYPQNA